MTTDPFALAGKTAVVVGAATGIGRAASLSFAAAGANVLAADLDAAGAEETAAQAGENARGHRVDVTDPDGLAGLIAAATEAFGAIHVGLYAAATYDRGGTVLQVEEAEWLTVMDVNLNGAFRFAKAALPAMIGAGGGSLILVASQLGSVASPGRAAYCATKGALVQLAKVLAADHAGDNIRVNTLSPGAIETGRLTWRYGDMAAARAALGPKHLLDRLGLPHEIANAALFLASDASSFMTGADLLVDGGYNAV